ncbi:MAG TPA: hypothetical protein PLR74_15785, partial [Agriterribacter sp.]|nr:hypothetical protein [Agriterribacter sp.]
MLLVLLVMNRLHCFTGIVFLLLLSLYAGAQDRYRLHYIFTGKDTGFLPETSGLQTTFASQAQCREYIDQAIRSLQLRGYITASADSMVFDSASARVWIYAGAIYQWTELGADSADRRMLAAIGWN